ncbi:MAG: hypothetical protein M3Q34_04505 [bacterium]|nr:hypothetical protein [bacterium]
MKTCSKCKKEKPLEEFSYKSKSLGKRQYQCKECTRLLIKKHYCANKQYYLNKTRNRNKHLRNEVNVFLKEYLLQHPCVDCGENDIIVLEFDHRREEPKLKAVSHLVRAQVSLDVVKKEIEKCEVRCANCHRRKTAIDFNWFKSIN